MTVPQNVKLARHPIDLDDNGHEFVEKGVTGETDTSLRLAPAGDGTVIWSTGGGGGGGSLPWIDVTDPAYGAVGDGTTDDTAAINLAIAALNTATRGVLYFPAGIYKITAALTTITAGCTILGDGMAGFAGTSASVSRITTNHATANIFTLATGRATVRGLAFDSTAATPSAGAAVASSLVSALDRHDVIDCSFEGTYYGCDLQGTAWIVRGCHFYGPVKYGVYVRNTSNSDFGDWVITECSFWSGVTADAAIRIESSGGGKITNCKVNMAGSTMFGYGVDLAVTTGGTTSILLISGNSFENVSGDGIRLTSTGSGVWDMINVVNNQFGLYGNNTGRIVNASGSGIRRLLIDDNLAATDGTARAAIAISSVTGAYIGRLLISSGFNAVYTNSGSTFVDDTGSIATVAITGTPSSGDVPIASSGTAAAWGAPSAGASFATPAIVLGTAAAAGAAATVIRSDSTIVAFDATVPVTQAFGDSAATGSAAVAARRDHKHGMPATPATTGQILIADTHSTPLIFADLLQTEAQDDLLYAD